MKKRHFKVLLNSSKSAQLVESCCQIGAAIKGRFLIPSGRLIGPELLGCVKADPGMSFSSSEWLLGVYFTRLFPGAGVEVTSDFLHHCRGDYEIPGILSETLCRDFFLT